MKNKERKQEKKKGTGGQELLERRSFNVKFISIFSMYR